MYLPTPENRRVLASLFSACARCSVVVDAFDEKISNPEGEFRLENADLIGQNIRKFMQVAAGGKWLWQGTIDSAWGAEAGFDVKKSKLFHKALLDFRDDPYA